MDFQHRERQPGDRVFNRYTLVRILGSGGMGVVWLAHDEVLGISTALKFLKQQFTEDLPYIERLKRETRQGRSISHPQVVRVFDFIADGSDVAIAMEYVSGVSLSQFRHQQPEGVLEVSQISDFIIQLCEVLEYVHRVYQVVHRDLKPSNIFLESGGSLKLIDFGLTIAPYPITKQGLPSDFEGTPAYSSPQQILGETPTPSDDIFSLGASLYELLTGESPYSNPGPNLSLQDRGLTKCLVSEKRRERGVGKEPIPKAWDKTIARCLAHDPKDRPETALQVLTLLGLRSKGRSSLTPVADASGSYGLNPDGGWLLKWLRKCLAWFQKLKQQPAAPLPAESNPPKAERATNPSTRPTDDRSTINQSDLEETVIIPAHLRLHRQGEVRSSPPIPEPSEPAPSAEAHFGETVQRFPSLILPRGPATEHSLGPSVPPPASESRDTGHVLNTATAHGPETLPKTLPAERAHLLFIKARDLAKSSHSNNDLRKALDLYEEASSLGCPEAQFAIGQLHHSGRGVTKSMVVAVALYQQAAQQRFVSAMSMLAYCYENGLGMMQNISEAIRWYEQAGAAGDFLALEKAKALRTAPAKPAAESQPATSLLDESELEQPVGDEKIFLSYSRRDIERVFQIVTALRAQGFRIWMDVASLDGSARWRDEIERAISNCSILIFMASQHSIRSKWVVKEINYADSLDKSIVPVLLDPLQDLGPGLRLTLNDLQRISYHRMDQNRGLQKIHDALARIGLRPDKSTPGTCN